MFDLQNHRTLVNGLQLIVDNKVILFSDGENDLLFSGTNIFGNRILSSIIGEDDELGFLRYFHLLVTDDQYYSFLTHQITLLELLRRSEAFFIVDLDYNYKEIQHTLYSFDEFPKDYLPLENSFCPSFVKESSFNYTISLKGGYSDLHLTKPQDLNLINNTFNEFLQSSTEFIRAVNLDREIYIEALKAGSFEIKFKINLILPEQTTLFPVNTENIEIFVKDMYSYVFTKLPNEEDGIFKKDVVESIYFKNLEDKLNDIYLESNISLPAGGLQQKLIDTINYSITNFKNIPFGSSFDKIEFKSVTKRGEEIPIALIDKDYISKVSNKFYDIESENKPDFIELDDFPTTYKIQVYQFNIQSGNGRAFILVNEEFLEKISIHAKGKSNYQNTIFTKSLDEGKFVEIDAIAKKVNGKIKDINYQFS